MKSPFRHAALVGKYNVLGSRKVLDEVARFLIAEGLEVSMERQTALNTGLTDYGALTPDELGKVCDIAVVVGASTFISLFVSSKTESISLNDSLVTTFSSFMF